MFNKNIGTVSDREGKFRLKLNENNNLNDEVTFSCIGFKSQNYKISSLLDKENVIELVPKSYELNQVEISIIAPKKKKIGKPRKGLGLTHMNFYSAHEKEVDDRLSKEMGMKFNIRKDYKINDLNFNITSNQFKSIKFRVNFYKIENGLPGDLLFTKNIIFEIKDAYLGWFKIDLRPYDLYFKKEIGEVAVTIQWLESEKLTDKSKYFSVSAGSSPLTAFFYRGKAMAEWDKTKVNLSFYLNVMYDKSTNLQL